MKSEEVMLGRWTKYLVPGRREICITGVSCKLGLENYLEKVVS